MDQPGLHRESRKGHAAVSRTVLKAAGDQLGGIRQFADLRLRPDPLAAHRVIPDLKCQPVVPIDRKSEQGKDPLALEFHLQPAGAPRHAGDVGDQHPAVALHAFVNPGPRFHRDALEFRDEGCDAWGSPLVGVPEVREVVVIPNDPGAVRAVPAAEQTEDL